MVQLHEERHHLAHLLLDAVLLLQRKIAQEDRRYYKVNGRQNISKVSKSSISTAISFSTRLPRVAWVLSIMV